MKKSYLDIVKDYNEENYFYKSTIIINYINDQLLSSQGERNYKITSLHLFESNDLINMQKLSNLVERCNKSIIKDGTFYTWQVFYVYKELLQGLLGEELGFNYFRGQSDNYDLLPGALRKNTNKFYIDEFESIYRKMAYEFPDKLKYIALSGDSAITERECHLSLLQHYGLKTALLDITKNPFIAMLFMLSDTINEYKEPTLYLFKINDHNVDNEKITLFSEVEKSQVNERINAQKGAFLNYEKVLLEKNELKKIPYVKIILRFDTEKYSSVIDGEIDLLNKMKTKVDRSIIDTFRYVLEKEKTDCSKTKVECIDYINCELNKKLHEYFYTKEDMFPDFENKIRYLSNKYNKYEKQDKSYNKAKE